MLPWQPPGNTPEEMYGMWRCSEVYWHGRKKTHVRKMWFCGSITFSFRRLGNVVYWKQWLKARSWWVPIYLYEAISCSDLPEVLYRQPLLFLWLKEKEQRTKFDSKKSSFAKNNTWIWLLADLPISAWIPSLCSTAVCQGQTSGKVTGMRKSTIHTLQLS